MKAILILATLLLSVTVNSQVVLYDQTAQSAPGYLYANHFTDIDTYIKTADDFTVPVGEVWSLTQVEIQAYSPNYSIPDSTLVEVFADNNGTPGAIVYSEVHQFNACIFAAPGIAWPTIDIATQGLSEGTYWISLTGYTLEANIWTWNLVGSTNGNDAVFMDPNGYSTSPLAYWAPISAAGATETGMNFKISGIQEMANIVGLEKDPTQIYPNPVSSKCTIELPEDVLFYELMDLKGKLIQTISKSASNEYDFSSLESGVYFVLWSKNEQIFQQKLIKN